MELTRRCNGTSVTLVGQIADSGEGTVWYTDQPGLVAKIYHHPTQERMQKLESMLTSPPADPMAGRNHVTFAWPVDIVRDRFGAGCGFLMPEIKGSHQFVRIYNPFLRSKLGLDVGWDFLHVFSMNFSLAVQELHKKGYVLGDIKPQNILVNNKALPSVIDSDSFQVRDRQTGRTFRCLVGSEGFTPPELLGKSLSGQDQTEYHDRFRLAVIVYLALIGEHPFKGSWNGNGEPPGIDELVKEGHWPYGPRSLIGVSPNTISLEVAHPLVRGLFLRAFNEGLKTPELRPSPAEWAAVLKEASANLVICKSNNRHYYTPSRNSCYWCERALRVGVDIFRHRQDTGEFSIQKCPRCSQSNRVITSRIAGARCKVCQAPLWAPGHQASAPSVPVSPSGGLQPALGSKAFWLALGNKLKQFIYGLANGPTLTASPGGGWIPPPPPTLSQPPQSSAPTPTGRGFLGRGNIIGHSGSRKYHGPSCKWGRKIASYNAVYFHTWQEAEARGFLACRACGGRY